MNFNPEQIVKILLAVTPLIVVAIFCTGYMDNRPKNRLNTGNGTLNDPQKIESPRIDFVSPSPIQPQEADTSVIWFDNFDNKKEYMDSEGELDRSVRFGDTGASMKAGFKKGEVKGEGNRKLAFGDFPGTSSLVLKKAQKFDDIYWRIYVKHEYGWRGAPAKLSRATSIASQDWKQAMIAHVWSGDNNTLTLDPARGVKGQTDEIVTTKYNDFEHLTWLGNKPDSKFEISSTEESGYWVLVESRVKLNTPGKDDGINQLWIDGRLEAERLNLNLRGSYTKHGINAVFLESYWNSGSPKDQERWFDNFVVSTKPIGPVVCPANPILHRTPYYGPGKLKAWKVEIASDYLGKDVVFRSKKLVSTDSVTITAQTGSFDGSLFGSVALLPGSTYFCRIRQQSTNGEWSGWSRWHQGFKVK